MQLDEGVRPRLKSIACWCGVAQTFLFVGDVGVPEVVELLNEVLEATCGELRELPANRSEDARQRSGFLLGVL